MPQTQPDQDRFDRMLDSGHPAIRISTTEENEARTLVELWCKATGSWLWVWTAVEGVRAPLAMQGPFADTMNPAGALVWMARRDHPAVFCLNDMADHLGDPLTLRALRELIETATASGSRVILIDHASTVPPVIASHTTPFELSLPTEKQIEVEIRQTLKTLHRSKPIEIELSAKQYQLIVKNLAGMPRRLVRQIVREVVFDDRRFDADDLNHILAQKRQLMARDGLLEYVESPATLDDVGGLDKLKSWLNQRQGALSDEAVRFGLSPPRGVLMLGVQGAGKSLCAKAIATAWQRPLLRMDTGALYDRFVGESERRLRLALDQAQAMAPVVLWIDEIEKAFASAAARSTDGGLSQRMFGTLLTWMQDHEQPVFLVATANNIEALPPELLRKGRFDEIFFVDLPGPQARRTILSIHLRKRERDPTQFNLDELIEASEGRSGAEIEQAIIGALHGAFTTRSELKTGHIVEVLRTSPPLSVTMADRIERLRAWAQGRCVPAD